MDRQVEHVRRSAEQTAKAPFTEATVVAGAAPGAPDRRRGRLRRLTLARVGRIADLAAPRPA